MAKALKTLICRITLLLAIVAIAPALLAHQLDEYVQATLVEIEPGKIRLKLNLTPGVEIADKILPLIDPDRDGVVTPDEAAHYADLLRRDLSVELDGRNVEMVLTASNFPELSELRGGWGIIQIEFSLRLGSLGAGEHRLMLENQHLPVISAYLVNAAKPGSDLVRIESQRRNKNQSVCEIEFAVQQPVNALPANSLPLASSRTVGIIASLTALLLSVLVRWRVRRLRGAAQSHGEANGIGRSAE